MNNFSNFFKNDQGKIVIAQYPNTPLWLALVFKIISLHQHVLLNNLGRWGIVISLGYWSYLEITSGVNTFRKLLGLIIAITQLNSLYHLLTR